MDNNSEYCLWIAWILVSYDITEQKEGRYLKDYLKAEIKGILCDLLLLHCDKKTDKSNLKEQNLLWLTNSEGSVHGCLTLMLLVVKVSDGSCSLLFGRQEAERGRGQETQYNLQRHPPSDLLPPVSPHLPEFPHLSKIAPPTGAKHSKHEFEVDISYPSHNYYKMLHFES
jgi:hypothetical protein